MNEMIKRVALAIRDTHDEGTSSPYEQIGEDVALECARAAIAAMREPTDAMITAAKSGDDLGSSIFHDPFVAAPHDEAWRDMIDAALTED